MKDEIASKSTIDRLEWLIFSGLLLLALGLHIYSTFGGLIWTFDSFHYWAASRSFQSDMIFVAHDGGSFTFWPPLFPVILSFFNQSIYHVFHALCFLSSFFFIYLLFKNLASKRAALISLGLLVVSVYPYLMSSFLWSETLFTLLLFSGLYYYDCWHSRKSPKHLILAAVLLSLMCLQRNAGVFIVLGLSVFCFIIFLKNKNWGFLLKMVAIHILIVLPNVLWNLYQTIHFPEDYYISKSPFFINFFDNLEIFSAEFIRLFIPYGENAPFISTFILGTITIIILLIQNSKSLHFYVLATYLFLFLLLPTVETSEIARFLAPVFPIIMLQVVLLSKKIIRKTSSQKMQIAISVILSFFILYNIARTVKNTTDWNNRSIHHQKSAKIFF